MGMFEDAVAIMEARERAWKEKERALKRRAEKWDRVVGPMAAEFAEAAVRLEKDLDHFENATPAMEGWKITFSPVKVGPEVTLFGYDGAEALAVAADGSWSWVRERTVGFPARNSTQRVSSEDALNHSAATWSDILTDDELTAKLWPFFVERLAGLW